MHDSSDYNREESKMVKVARDYMAVEAGLFSALGMIVFTIVFTWIIGATDLWGVMLIPIAISLAIAFAGWKRRRD